MEKNNVEDIVFDEITLHLNNKHAIRLEKLKEAIKKYKAIQEYHYTSYRMDILDLSNNNLEVDLTYIQSRLYFDKSIKENDLKILGWSPKRGDEYNALLLKAIKNELL